MIDFRDGYHRYCWVITKTEDGKTEVMGVYDGKDKNEVKELLRTLRESHFLSTEINLQSANAFERYLSKVKWNSSRAIIYVSI